MTNNQGLSHDCCFDEVSLLSQLLPYDPIEKLGDKLKDGLKEYLVLIIAGEQAISAAKEGKLREFDSLVGENACQIRAVKLAWISSKFTFNCDELLHKFTDARKRIEQLLSHSIPCTISLREILEEEGLDILLHYNELFLIESFILSRIKVPKACTKELPLALHEATDTKKIREFYSIGRFFANELVRVLRESVSKKSVKFVQKIAEGFTCINSKMVSEPFTIDYKGLQCIPGYWTSEILMKHLLWSRIPIVLKATQKAEDQNYEIVNEITLFFEATEQGYRETQISSLDPECPALVIVGTTCRKAKDLPHLETWKEELLKYCPIQLMLAATAIHRQYPDPSKEDLVCHVHDENYQYYKAKAHEWGCSAQNPTRVFLSHVFCDKIKNLLDV